MRVSGIAFTLLLVVACGRTPLLGLQAHDGGAPRRDATLESDGAARTVDAAEGTRPEVRPPRPDTNLPQGCSALAALASRGVLTPRHANQVLFAKDRSSLVLRVSGRDAGTGDDVMLVRLPGGETSQLATGAAGIDWIDDGRRVLVRHSSGDLLSVSLDEPGPVVLARANACEHLISPDGSRVIMFGYCGGVISELSVIDTRTGMRTNLGQTVRKSYDFGPKVVFSPSGRWFAYLQPSPTADGSASYDTLVRVVDSRYNAYALKSAPRAAHPTFASDEVLLFATGRDSSMTVDVRAHVVGSGDASRVLARDVGFDSHFDGHVSPDGQWVLAAILPLPDYQSSYALSAFSLDGREVALAGDLFPFYTTDMLWHASAFAADNRHVVYLTSRPSFGTAVVERTGGAATPLSSDHSFVIPPTGNLVALIETHAQPMRVRLTNLDTTEDVAVAKPTGNPARATFTPNGASLVFVEEALGATPARLQHLSGSTGAVSALAQWNANQLLPFAPCCNEPGPGYPIDPTGCFTVVDSDLDGGTRLILLPQ
jgi:hypothetical protein